MSDSTTTPAKVPTPEAMVYRLIERDGTVWQIGRPWPTPGTGEHKSSAIDCVISGILLIDSEIDSDGDAVETALYYQIIGLPLEGGRFEEKELGVTTDIGIEDVYRVEGLQNSKVLTAYMIEMIKAAGVRAAAVPASPQGT